MKIVHTPFNVANNPRGICDAEQELGMFSRLEILHHDGFFDTADFTWSNGTAVMVELSRWLLMFKVLFKYDVIHYNNGSYISPKPIKVTGKFKFLKKIYNKIYAEPLEGIDLRLASLFNKLIFVTFQGSDARIIGFCKKNYTYHFSKEINSLYSEEYDNYILKRVKLFEKYADKIFAVNPDLLNTLSSKAVFIPYASVDTRNFKPEYKALNSEFTIVHAPSNRLVKGTQYLVNAVEKLKKENFNVKLVLIEGLTNKEALSVYKKADIVVDQLLAGWYGAFSVEAMALGKPVIAYIREDDLVHIPKEMKKDLPIINANPDSIYYVIKNILINEHSKLEEIGKKSRKFAEKWHSPKFVAQLIWGKNYNEK